ncbi:MAG: hypothetical protein LBV12_12920 [Puniceicoccales bacterium]|jgi:HD-like signal output (HDOD) protein|nr:hypothetical protein [Puniceicoccales bacterium]
MNQKIKNTLLVAIVPLLGVGIAVGIIVARNSGKFGELNPLQREAYMQNWATLQGNEYVISCQIDQQLSYREDKGRVLAVKLLDGTGRLPVLVPVSIKQNFETGQRYRFHVLVRQGTLCVEDIEKI